MGDAPRDFAPRFHSLYFLDLCDVFEKNHDT
jgi:hypothetical protein